MTAFEIWKKVQNEVLSDEEYKKLLIENNVIVNKDKYACKICKIGFIITTSANSTCCNNCGDIKNNI